MGQWKNLAWGLACLFSAACGGEQATPPGDKDTQAPTFDGATGADLLSDGWTRVTWEPATDDVSPSERLVYRVYVGTSGAPLDYSSPVALSPAGATSLGIPALPRGVELSLVVRALDEAGNEDRGTRAVTLTLPDPAPPQFPGVAKVVGLSGSSLEVGWDDARNPDAVDHFLVYLSEDSDSVAAAAPRTVAASSNAVVFEDLKEHTTYYAAVRAIDPNGLNDGNRKIVAGSTLDATPPDFTGLASATAGGTAVRLTWAEASDLVTASGALTYKIYAAEGTNDFEFDSPLDTVVGALTYIVAGLSPSTDYRFLVRVADASGNEDTNEEERSATTGATADSTPPAFPGAGNELAAVATSSRSIELSWTAADDDLTPVGAIVYDIWFSRESGGLGLAGAPQATSVPGATTFEVSDLEPTTTYFFIVRARDIAGLRDSNSNEVAATTKTDDVPPVFAGTGTVQGINATTIEVTWAAAVDDFPTANLIYDVYYATTAGGQNYALPNASVTGQTSVQFSGLTRQTPYYVVVRARDPDGNVAENTNEVSGSTLPDTTPPVLSSTPSVGALSQTSLQVTWSPASDDSYPASALTYQVFYGTSPSGPFTARPVTAPAASSDTITGLTVNTQYYAYVVPRDPTPNIGAPSPQGTALTSSDNTPPTFVGTPTLSGTTVSASFNTITLSWSAATDDFSPASSMFYEICRSTASTGCDTFTVYTTTPVNTLTSTLTSQTLGVRYYYRVRAVDQAGNRSTNGPTVTDDTTPSVPALPTLAFSGASINVTWTAATDSQFTNLRYRIEYIGSTLSGSTCSNTWLVGANIAQTTTGSTTPIKRYFATNDVRVVAIDGFGNETTGGIRWLDDYSNAAASAVLQPLWNANCNLAGCHGGPANLYPQWTVTTARQTPSPVYSALGAVVIPNNPSSSRMYDRVTRTDGLRMPPGGPTSVDLACNLRRWIDSGAP